MGFKEVIRSWGWALLTGISVLTKETPESSLGPPSSQRMAVYVPGSEPTVSAGILILDFQLQNCETQIFAVYKPLSLWHFVRTLDRLRFSYFSYCIYIASGGLLTSMDLFSHLWNRNNSTSKGFLWGKNELIFINSLEHCLAHVRAVFLITVVIFFLALIYSKKWDGRWRKE